VTGSEHTQTFGADRGAEDRVGEDAARFDLDRAYRAHAAITISAG